MLIGAIIDNIITPIITSIIQTGKYEDNAIYLINDSVKYLVNDNGSYLVINDG